METSHRSLAALRRVPGKDRTTHPGRRPRAALTTTLAFPTSLHEQAANAAVDFFSGRAEVDAVLVIASCARGKAVPESDLDMAVLVDTSEDGRRTLEEEWMSYRASSDAVARLCGSSRFAQLHLDLTRAIYEPQQWDDGGGPDDFEVEIGNHVAYSVPIWGPGLVFAQRKANWLPYYDEALQTERLRMAREACLNDLNFIPFYIERELYFQAFDRLYKAFREFLQALFIARRTYPIAYNKWIREQVCELIQLPKVYAELPAILENKPFEGAQVGANAAHLRRLVDRWLT